VSVSWTSGADLRESGPGSHTRCTRRVCGSARVECPPTEANLRDFEFGADAEPDASLFGNLDGAEDAFEVAFKVEGVLVQAARGDGDEPAGGMDRGSCACPWT
jgi:hypothetical protein